MNQTPKKIPRITMRINILTVFLSLVFVSFTAVLAFQKYKNHEIIKEISEDTMNFVKKDLNNDVDDLFDSVEKLVLTGASLWSSPEQISPENEQLRAYMLSAVKYYSNVAFFYIGVENGDFVLVVDISLSNQTTYSSKPTVPLPKGAVYKWEIRQRSLDNPTETYYYLDEELNVLSSETFSSQNSFDPRERPWYKDAAAKKALHWTDVYTFIETNNPGVSVAQPLYDVEGNLFGVIAADLSFELLSAFFLDQKIGVSGKPFILDAKGNIIIPSPQFSRTSTISPEIVSQAFQAYQKNRISDFQLEVGGVLYLCDIEPFPVKAADSWLIAIIAPHADFFAELESAQKSAIFIVVGILGVASLAVIYLATKLSKPIVLLAREVDKVRQLDFSEEERVDSRIKEIYLMDEAIALMRSAVRSFTRYIPKEIVQALFSQNKEIKLGGEKREVTVLFSDIEGFTPITEAQPTEALMSLLAEYFDSLSKIILESQGTIDKYIGDSIMAFWGAPTPLPDHRAAAALAVLRCKAFVREFNQRCKEKNLPVFKTRFGMNSGVAIVGNIGTPERMNYTLIGDMVNAASRIQLKNKDYGTAILMSEAVYQQLGEAFLARPIDVVEVKGKKEKIALYELVAAREGPKEICPTPEEIDLCSRFSKAYEVMQANRREEAKKLFQELAKDFPDDLPTQRYLERLT